MNKQGCTLRDVVTVHGVADMDTLTHSDLVRFTSDDGVTSWVYVEHLHWD